jgi:hypothetical protein
MAPVPLPPVLTIATDKWALVASRLSPSQSLAHRVIASLTAPARLASAPPCTLGLGRLPRRVERHSRTNAADPARRPSPSLVQRHRRFPSRNPEIELLAQRPLASAPADLFAAPLSPQSPLGRWGPVPWRA